MATLNRAAEFDTRAADQAQRLVPVVLSTETPVDRGSYVEILDHDPASVDLSRAPLPLIEAHDTRKLPIGVVENLGVEGRKLRGIARFGSSARALEVFRDVVDGVVRSVSIGYEQVRELGRDGRAVRFAFRPHEASATAVPADPAAGFYRSKDFTMSTIDTAGPAGNETRASGQSIAAERERVADITQIAQRWSADPHLVQRAIGEGWAPDRFGRTVLQGIAERQAPALPGGGFEAGIGLSSREVRHYSVLRAIRAIAEGRPDAAPLEMEASRTLARQLGREPRGFFVPYEVQRRDLTAASATQGGKLVGTDHRPQDFVELLRSRLVVQQLGARRITGLVGNVAIPKQTAAGTAYWLANEATAITESDQTIGQLTLTPKNVGAYTEISKQLTMQSAPDAETMVMDDLARVVAIAIDTAAINGSGLSGQPAGLIGAAGIGAVTGTSLGIAGIMEFQTDVAAANALVPGCAFLTTPAVAALLSQRQRFASTDTPLWSGSVLDGTVAGFRATSTTLMPAATMIFGDWSQIIIGEWGVLELEVNPYANFPAGIIGVRAWASVDVAIRQAGAFSVASSIT
jgi:HK97 family phage major capsid protein